MPKYRCHLGCYGLILHQDRERLYDAVHKDLCPVLDVVRNKRRRSEPFLFFNDLDTRELPPDLGVALLSTGVYWEWTTHILDDRQGTMGGIFFDAEAGRSIHFRCDAKGTPRLAPFKLGQARDPECQRILSRMPEPGVFHPLLCAENQHEALSLTESDELPAGVAGHCLAQRGKLRR